MNEYGDIIAQMYDRITAFVRRHPEIEKELFARQREFERLSFKGNSGRLFFDWFIFDYHLQSHQKRLLDVFLEDEKDKVPPETFERYAAAGQDRFGIYQVLAVRTGKEFRCRNALSDSGGEFQVRDRSSAGFLAKGDYLVGRLLPFDDVFIMASDGLHLPQQEYDVIGLVLKQFPDPGARLDALDLYKALFPQEIPEQLGAEEKFVLMCREGGLSDDEIEDIQLEMRMAIQKRGGSPQEVMKDLLERMRVPEWFRVGEFSEAVQEMWNHYVGQIHPHSEKGPLETMLVRVCMDAAIREIGLPQDLSDKGRADFSRNVKAWSDRWFVTPLKHLNGKTPKEVILEERRRRGNPQTEFGFSIGLDAISADPHQEREAERLFHQAAAAMAERRHDEALALYEEYLKLWDGNHVVWHNMAVCYVVLLQKRKALACLRRALEINPEYELARDRLEQLEAMDKAEMTAMVRGWQRQERTDGKTKSRKKKGKR